MQAETFSTVNVPMPEQFDAWLGWFGRIFDVLPHDPPHSGFRAQNLNWQIGSCMLSRVWAPAIRVVRDITHVRRNPLDHWVITSGRHATSLISTGDKTLSVPPGTPFVLSLSDELTSERLEDCRLQLYMSRDNFSDLAPALDRARGTVVAPPLGALLRDYLRLLERILPSVGSNELERLSDAIGAMVAACLAPEQNRAESVGPQIELIWLERIRRAVRSNLRSPRLGPRLICQQLSISRSKLYRLMDVEGGVARYIRSQRLLEAYALLSDPRTERSITALADELCFSDTSSFSRAFRREFGATPSDVRAASRTTPTSPAPVNGPTVDGLYSLLRSN